MLLCTWEYRFETLLSNLLCTFPEVIKKNFFFIILATLGLPCCTWAFSSCAEWELFFVVVCGLLLQWLLRSAGSVVVAHGLGRSASCAIFPG